MAERTNIQATTGAVLSLSAERPPSGVFDAADYADTGIDWTEIGEVEDLGEHGMEAQIIEFVSVNDGVVQKLKGSKNYGNMSLMIGHVPSDAGQALLAAASESQNRYSARIVYPLGDGEVAAEKHYMDVLVASRRFNDGNANNVRRIAVVLAICRKPVEVDAT